MAALVAGVQYGLSSHSNFHENKSLIFVKLTDSAQRAIEDFLKNRSKTSLNPTIQFLGNEGQLSFPSTQSSHGSAGFTFSLSGNHDIEGPQGGFECIQQTGAENLESLGALPCKMRIQANDDVYETTRHRMAVAEETSKNKCTRVIKANGPDIGRKVKVKAAGRATSSLVNRHREPPIIPSNVSQLSRLASTSSSLHQINSSTSTALPSSPMSLNTYKPISSHPSVRSQPDKKLSELVRRPLKERLIHVLALRPYKKPELYDRITKEGIKDRDRSTMTMILKQVAFMRDNTYHLHRHVWNDVQEDWPFYTEQDRSMLKRRKPQNLTPPGSSDGGSSGSGQSPNSTHPGSPPAITVPSPNLMSSKRPGYYQGNDGLQTKRPRISHYRKPESTTNTSGSNITANHSSCRENLRTTGVNDSSDNVSKNDWENLSTKGQQHRNDFRVDRTDSDVISCSYGTNKSCLTPTSDSEDNHSRDNNQNSSMIMTTGENEIYKSVDASVDVLSTSMGYGDSPNGLNDRNNRSNMSDRNDRTSRKERGGPNDEKEHSAKDNTISYNEFPSLSSSTYSVNNANLVTSSLIPSSPTIQRNKKSEYPDYLTQYMAISSTEQRRRYKTEFNADYEEYRKLHTQVAKVSRRFAQLDECRQRELENGNHEKCEVLKEQIVAEYMATKRDPAHIETKKRFHYLHEKLSHIKRLVLEYDTQNFASSLTNSNSATNDEDAMMNGGSLRY